MTNTIDYELIRDEEIHTITITPLNEKVPGGDIYVTNIFKLTEGDVGMGELAFDDQLDEWEYNGTGDVTHEEADEIAKFIKDQAKRIM